MSGGRSLLGVMCLILKLIMLCLFLKQDQVESLRQRCELQDVQHLKSTKKAHVGMSLVKGESVKSKAANEVID